MLVTTWVRPVQGLLIGAFFSVLIFGAMRGVAEYRGSRDRRHIVASLVREQLVEMRKATSSAELTKRRLWPDEFVPLRNWVVNTGFVTSTQELSNALTELVRNRDFSHRLGASLNRWQETLSRWSGVEARINGSHNGESVPGLLSTARQCHFQATAYRKIGKSYDATILYLWTAVFLYRYIDRFPQSEQLPEALFLLGDAVLRLQNEPRLLSLCADIFPESVWAGQARAVMTSELGDARI